MLVILEKTGKTKCLGKPVVKNVSSLQITAQPIILPAPSGHLPALLNKEAKRLQQPAAINPEPNLILHQLQKQSSLQRRNKNFAHRQLVNERNFELGSGH
jgi:hypothetical protein